MKSHPAACLAVAALGMAGVKTFAQDWPQWRGPSSHGVSTETGLPTTGNESENVAWRVALAGLGTSSPIVWGDRVIVTSQVGSSELADGAEHPRLARDDGALAGREQPIWRPPARGRRNAGRGGARRASVPQVRWRTAVGVSHPGPRTAARGSYDPSTGALLWFTGGPRQTPIPSGVAHDGRIYLSRGYRNSDYMAIRPGGRGDVTATHVAWRAPSGASYVPCILYYDGLLYMTNDVGVLTCADART